LKSCELGQLKLNIDTSLTIVSGDTIAEAANPKRNASRRRRSLTIRWSGIDL